jgi:hypothetical protein
VTDEELAALAAEMRLGDDDCEAWDVLAEVAEAGRDDEALTLARRLLLAWGFAGEEHRPAPYGEWFEVSNMVQVRQRLFAPGSKAYGAAVAMVPVFDRLRKRLGYED